MQRSYSKTVYIPAPGLRSLAILAAVAILVSGAVVGRAALEGGGAPTDQAQEALVGQATPPAATPEAESPLPVTSEVAAPEGVDSPTTVPDVAQTAQEITPAAQEATGLAAGDTVVVDADGLNVRTEPSLQGDVAVVLPRGQQATVVAGPTDADGFTWYRLDVNGTRGWSASEFLTPA